MLNRLQYITESPALAEEACRAGVKWVQARVKCKSLADTKEIVCQIISICRNHNAVCIVNDFIDLALELNADGVHLGKNDLSIREAKKKIGNRNFILGGTANTLEDVKELSDHDVTYIGLGPFRFTTTKEKLSPVLGLAGYENVISSLRKERSQHPPVYAIGGIVSDDVSEINATGVYGVAVSSVISNARDKQAIVKEFYKNLNREEHAKQ